MAKQARRQEPPLADLTDRRRAIRRYYRAWPVQDLEIKAWRLLNTFLVINGMLDERGRPVLQEHMAGGGLIMRWMKLGTPLCVQPLRSRRVRRKAVSSRRGVLNGARRDQ